MRLRAVEWRPRNRSATARQALSECREHVKRLRVQFEQMRRSAGTRRLRSLRRDRLPFLTASRSEPAVESLDPSLGVHDALLAREERVALLADLHVQFRLGRTRRVRLAARAGDRRVGIVRWMNIGLHGPLLRGGYSGVQYSIISPPPGERYREGGGCRNVPQDTG